LFYISNLVRVKKFGTRIADYSMSEYRPALTGASETVREAKSMIRWTWAKTNLVLLFAITAAAPGYAVAQPPVPDWKHGNVPYDAVLYETTENLNMKALQRERRKATSSLLGFARRGSALCPEALVLKTEPTAEFCTLNATGSDNISLVTGLGTFGGDVEVTVQEVVGTVVDPATGESTPVITPDSPEVVIARGRFTGKMDFSPAIVGLPDGTKIPLGSVDGFLSLGAFSGRVPFKGVFRLPFVVAAGVPPMYLLSDGTLILVLSNEMAIGYPTVRFEIFFSF
jgi:hypothetical protein